MKRIDAHQHFWIYNDTDYTWMSSAHGAIRRDFTPEDLSPLLDSIGFDGSVAVQARQTMEETEFLLSLADQSDRVFGVVGWLDLRSERIADEIARYGANPKLKGVRHVVHDEPDDDFVLRDSFRRGVRALGPAGLTYDLLLFPRHIPAAIRLVDEFPNQPFVVDHIAKPPIKDGATEPWARDIAQLAERPNVTCKLSGMVTEANRDSWRPEDLYPYIDIVLEAFGASRLMIGSDWPVCTLAGEYKRVMDVVLNYIAKLSTHEQEMITGGTCMRFYGIEG
ncbi:MAG: amidohydrolase [Spirochaetaceae bacterium]|nr:MAG: amidohydrolase [Spirochaetaceae bacterium]